MSGLMEILIFQICGIIGGNIGGIVGSSALNLSKVISNIDMTVTSGGSCQIRLGGILGVNEEGGIAENLGSLGKISLNYNKNNRNIYIGGILGKNNGTINNGYYAGKINKNNVQNNGEVCLGGTIGINELGQNGNDLYFLNDSFSLTGGEVIFKNEIEKTKEEMQSEDFVKLLNENKSIWIKDKNLLNNGYPFLAI